MKLLFISFFLSFISLINAQVNDSIKKVESKERDMFTNQKKVFEKKTNLAQPQRDKNIFNKINDSEKKNKEVKHADINQEQQIEEKDEHQFSGEIIVSESIIKDDTFESINNITKLSGPTLYDSRIELLQLNPFIDWQLEILKKSESVALIVEKEKLSAVTSDIFYLDVSNTLGKVYNLCKEEAFANQPIVGNGTAFIFSENTMLTAKHVFERPLENYAIIFGYKMIQSNQVVENFFDKNNIYYPVSIVKDLSDLDVVQFKVDRNFNKQILNWENSSTLKNRNEIYMIGHPSGLPKKVALNASIQDNSHQLYYYTSLDSFQGNSGSPVFNFYTNNVIGILVSGELDYKYNGNCYHSTLCKIPYCKGEKVIRIEEIIKNFN